MARPRPATTGYERLAQADGLSDDSDDEAHDTLGGAPWAAAGRPGDGHAPRYASVAPPRAGGALVSSVASSSLPAVYGQAAAGGIGGGGGGGRRRRANSGVDLSAINARLERWADEIAAKFSRGGGGRRRTDADAAERLEIHYSVFQAPAGVRPATAEGLAAAADAATDDRDDAHMSQAKFESIVGSVRAAIVAGVHPRMIAQGSSGSYFARNLDGQVVGVFKPKDEEPYAAGNPKWNKWIHRNLFPCCFGRACLIPNLSYVSEAAAYVLDAQLQTHMVPYTDVVYLASKSFHYPFWDRYSHSRNGKPLPAKPGSFQVFLQGFKDANIFLREHPWPDQYLSGFRTRSRRGGRRRWADNCRPSSRPASAAGRRPSSAGNGDGAYDDAYSDYEDNASDSPERPLGPDHFVWTEPLKAAFREQLEKLVVLDYIMRNTDRGLDNWMIKVDWSTQAVSIVSEPMHLSMEGAAGGSGGTPETETDGDEGPRPVDLAQRGSRATRAAYRAQQPMQAGATAAGTTSASTPTNTPQITIGAIDNSLSWPWKHPDAWRSFPFGWLFLPVDLIGRPFSQRTRDHFLPLLTSTAWWAQTQVALRRVFQMDPDFQERMFARQMAVMKGQAWNVVETLKTADHGPLELTRRAKVCVWDDLVEVPIAVPMRATSSEIRRRAESELARAMEEEMDIGVEGGGGGPTLVDIGGTTGATTTTTGTTGTTGATRATTTTSTSPPDLLGRASPPPQARLTIPGRFDGNKEAAAAHGTHPPTGTNSRTAARHERRYSYAAAATGSGNGHANGNGHGLVPTIAQALHAPHTVLPNPFGQPRERAASVDRFLYDEDLEGDLGYAAAAGMENNRRRVIVERLEPVKSKNPVFTWC